MMTIQIFLIFIRFWFLGCASDTRTVLHIQVWLVMRSSLAIRCDAFGIRYQFRWFTFWTRRRTANTLTSEVYFIYRVVFRNEDVSCVSQMDGMIYGEWRGTPLKEFARIRLYLTRFSFLSPYRWYGQQWFAWPTREITFTRTMPSGWSSIKHSFGK